MKNFCRIAMLALVVSLLATSALAQDQAPPAALTNLIEGVGSITTSSSSWSDYTALTLIPGSGLFGVKATTNSLYLGFVGGSTVDVGNMVLYKTAPSSSTVLSAKKVTLGGVANPTINLTSTSVCPNQPVSVTNPCIIKLDPIKGALSTLNDYYFAIYFVNDSNNGSISGARTSSAQGSLSGWYVSGDQTKIKAKKILPSGSNGGNPYFLLYVENQ
jgi:hypothetical protein